MRTIIPRWLQLRAPEPAKKLGSERLLSTKGSQPPDENHGYSVARGAGGFPVSLSEAASLEPASKSIIAFNLLEVVCRSTMLEGAFAPKTQFCLA